MNARLLGPLVALVSGLIFGLGLLISGMNNPAKVRAFLGIFAAWDPSLIAVMGSAIPVFALFFYFSKRRKTPFCAAAFHEPKLTHIDLRLLAGALLFGIGWGLVGLCPGPALVNLLAFEPGVLVFVLALLAGNRAAHWLVGPAR